jgi:hypothetical protein
MTAVMQVSTSISITLAYIPILEFALFSTCYTATFQNLPLKLDFEDNILHSKFQKIFDVVNSLRLEEKKRRRTAFKGRRTLQLEETIISTPDFQRYNSSQTKCVVQLIGMIISAG